MMHAKSPLEKAAPRGYGGSASSYGAPAKKVRKEELLCHSSKTLIKCARTRR